MRNWVDDYGEPAAETAVAVAIELKARGIRRGALANWFKTSDTWRCPCCARLKTQIARLDRNGELFGPIVEHHDHVIDGAGPESVVNPFVGQSMNNPDVKAFWDRRMTFNSNLGGLIRFPNTWICGDCNNADAAAKALVDAPQWFSFAPFEIRMIVVPRARQACELRDESLIDEVFRPALEQATTLRKKRLYLISEFNERNGSGVAESEDVVSLAQASWNVMKDANRSRRAAE